MLVLSRCPKETIQIGENITVTIVEIRGDKCRIAIDAPADVKVWRGEIWAEIQRNEALDELVDQAQELDMGYE